MQLDVRGYLNANLQTNADAKGIPYAVAVYYCGYSVLD